MAWPSCSHPDGRIGLPSRRAPPPRTASKRMPDAWFTTTAARGPSASTAHRLVAYQGIPREALVEPSTGSITTTRGRSTPVGARLLGHDTEPGGVEHRHGGTVSGQVRPVLAVAGSGQTPVAQTPEGLGHRRGRGVKHLEQSIVVHGPTIPEPSGSR